MTSPAIILVEPQLGENIGHTARAMLNFGLRDLRLVTPRDGWPNPAAAATAAGADEVLEKARVFDSLEAAVADLQLVYAATVRVREMPKPVLDPEAAAKELVQSQACGVLFGPERSGLANEDVALADAVLTIPVKPDFASLNLAQAVILVAYEWSKAAGKGAEPPTDAEPAAPRDELLGLIGHFEDELDKRQYFHPEERRSALKLALRNLLSGAGLNAMQVRTLRGVIAALTRPPKDQD
jgi:tRNA/rRNA methyltransferase